MMPVFIDCGKEEDDFARALNQLIIDYVPLAVRRHVTEGIANELREMGNSGKDLVAVADELSQSQADDAEAERVFRNYPDQPKLMEYMLSSLDSQQQTESKPPPYTGGGPRTRF